VHDALAPGVQFNCFDEQAPRIGSSTSNSTADLRSIDSSNPG
jgi:hypothetical protein